MLIGRRLEKEELLTTLESDESQFVALFFN